MIQRLKSAFHSIRRKAYAQYYKWKYPALYDFTPGEKEWHRDAKLKLFKPTISAINSFLDGKWKVVLSFNTLDGKEVFDEFPIDFKESADQFVSFKITSKTLFSVKGVGMGSSYGLGKELTINGKNNNKRFVRENSVLNFSTVWPQKPQVLSGSFRNISTRPYSQLDGYFVRMIIRVEDSEMVFPSEILAEKNFMKFDDPDWDRQRTLMGMKFMTTKGQFCEVPIGNATFDFYALDPIKFQVIESTKKIAIEEFRMTTKAIRSIFAFLCGKYYRQQVFYLCSNHADFDTIAEIYYEGEPFSTITDMQLINPTMYFSFLDGKDEEEQGEYAKYRTMFPIDIFGKLCELYISNRTIATTIDLIIEGNQNLNPIQKGAIFSVAIETIANEVYEKNKTKLKPIVDKKLAASLRADFAKALAGFESQISKEAFDVLNSKIDNINQPTNRNRLIKPFEIMGLELTEDETELLEHRNDFLHGKYPDDDVFEITRICLEFHHLIGCLILKMVGYSGFVTNLGVAHLLKDQVKAKKHIRNFDPAKVMSADEIQKKIAAGEIDEVREIIQDTINAYKAVQKLSSFIRVI